MVLSNVKKNKGTIECDKITVTCNIGSAQYENGTIECEKENKRITKYDNSTVTCDVSTAQCEDSTIECEKKKKRKRTIEYKKK